MYYIPSSFASRRAELLMQEYQNYPLSPHRWPVCKPDEVPNTLFSVIEGDGRFSTRKFPRLNSYHLNMILGNLSATLVAFFRSTAPRTNHAQSFNAKLCSLPPRQHVDDFSGQQKHFMFARLSAGH